MMKIDLHCHCSPVSLCAHIFPEDAARVYKSSGIDGVVVTNHYSPEHLDALSCDIEMQKDEYINTFNRFKQEGEKLGLVVMFGAEVKLIHEKNKPEFLLYGITVEQFRESFPLYNLSQQELFTYCQEKNIVMVQSHPYRTEQGYAPSDPKYLHGVEVYNSHPCFDNRTEQCVAFAQGKIKTAGSDFHNDFQVATAYMDIPVEINNITDLKNYLINAKEYCLCSKDGIVYKGR